MGEKLQTVKEKLNIHYRILLLDLTQARSNEVRDLESKVSVYNELAVLYAPSAFSFRLNEKDNDLIPVQANQTLTISYFEFSEIYFTNDAGAGTAYIWVASRLK